MNKYISFNIQPNIISLSNLKVKVIKKRKATTKAAFLSFLVFIKTFCRLLPERTLDVERRIKARTAKNKLKSKKSKGKIIKIQLPHPKSTVLYELIFIDKIKY